MFDTKLIGKKIAALRKAKDMTQMELADQMFVSYQAVSNWGEATPCPIFPSFWNYHKSWVWM